MDFGVLFVSPYPQDAHSLAGMLDEISGDLIYVRSLKAAARKLETVNFQVVLTEAKLPDGSWLDALRLTRPFGIELVVTDAWADARFWAEAINRGAYDFLAQPFQTTEARRVLASAASRRLYLRAEAAVS